MSGRPDCPEQTVKSGLVVSELILRPAVPGPFPPHPQVRSFCSLPLPHASLTAFLLLSFSPFGAKELRAEAHFIARNVSVVAYNGCMFIVTASPRRGGLREYRETVNSHSSPPQCLQSRKLLVPLAAAEDEEFQAREHLRTPTIAVSQTMAPGIQRTRR